jgi:hypothetical protein
MSDLEPPKSDLDKATDGTGGANAAFGGANGFRQMYNNLTHTDMYGLPDMELGLNDVARPFSLNYDPPPGAGATSLTPGEAAMQAPLGESALPPPTAELSAADEEAWFAGASNPAALEAGEASEAYEAAEASAGTMNNVMGGVGGALGLVGGTVQAIDGYKRFTKDDAKEQDHVHGGMDMLGGAAGVVGGGLGLAASGALGAGLAAAAAPAAAVAAPIAAAIGLGVAGDHRAEDMHLFGKDADGNYQGAVEAAWNEGQHLGDAADKALGGGTLGLIGGAATAGLSTVGLEAGAAVADVGLGVDALGASSGLFGTAKNADGQGTHNMGAFEALDHAGQSAGSGVDSFFGLDEKSLGGEIVGGATRGLVDAAGSGLALAGDAVGGIVGGAKALWDWL